MHLHDVLSFLHSQVSQFFYFKSCLRGPLACPFVILSADLNTTCLIDSLQENRKVRPIIIYMLYRLSKAKCFPSFLLPLSALMKLAGYPTARSDAPFSSPEAFGQEFGATDTKAGAQLCETGWPSSAERELAVTQGLVVQGLLSSSLKKMRHLTWLPDVLRHFLDFESW